MHVAFVNPQRNFDPDDSYWTAHPDFGGQLVYVKELALAMGNLVHKVDIVTRRIIDPAWPEFASDTDAYPDAPNVRILRIPCSPDEFLPKVELWPYLGTEFVPRMLDLYEREGSLPDAVTAHYGDGGLCAALIEEHAGIPFSFTAHSLGAQKMGKMGIPRDSIAQVDVRYHFSSRLVAERLAIYYKLDLLAVGETMVDFISHEMAHYFRTASQFSRYLGGQPANVAVYVAKLGVRSAVITKLGSDYVGEYVEDQLQHHGVGTEAVSRTGEAATNNAFITRIVSIPDFLVNRGADALLAVRQVDEEMISRARIVHTSAFALSRHPQRLAVKRAMRLNSGLGKIVTLDTNYDPRVWPDKVEAWEILAEVMPYVTIVKPSLEDTRRLFDFNMDEETLEESALTEFHDLGAEIVILTRSGGVVTVSDNGSVERVGPLPKVQVENVTGARDAFWSALLMVHLDGKSWPEAVRFAHEIASLKLRVEGHVERMIDRESIYKSLQSAGQRTT
jgi:sugar/nucleoside kinase (ribokinase family)